MRSLIRAELFRLRRSRSLWGLLLLTLLYGLGSLASWLATNRVLVESGEPERVRTLDVFLFHHAPYLIYIAAGFVCLFLGAASLSGGIRTRAALGDARKHIYLSLQVSATLGLFVLGLLFPFVIWAAGRPLYGPLPQGVRGFLACLLGTFFLCVTLGALFTALCLGSGLSPSLSPLPCAVLCLAAHHAAIQIKLDLELGRVQGSLRLLWLFLYDFLPTGQALQLNSMEADHLPVWILCSLLLSALCTAAGLAAFRRLDLN